MKIGIQTLPLNTNYGGILQAYALQTIMERLGHKVSLIELYPKPEKLPLWKMPLCYGKRIIMNLKGNKFPIFYEQKYNHNLPIIRQHTNRFIEQYIHIKRYHKFTDIQEHEFDAIIVGSDQVWRPFYYKNPADSYLNYTKNWSLKRIAYAASFATDKWEYTIPQTKECSKLAQKFDAISVREDSGINLCKEYLGVKAQHVLDPTMLLNIEDYTRLIDNAQTTPSKGSLLCYILDKSQEKQVLIDKIAVIKKLQAFDANANVDNYYLPFDKRIQPPVEQWLRDFRDAQFIVTDSFHACVFSILFKKQFIVYGNPKRGNSRIQSLLKIFGLQDRLFTDLQKLEKLKEIDYVTVFKQLEEWKKKSFDFLKNAQL